MAKPNHLDIINFVVEMVTTSSGMETLPVNNKQVQEAIIAVIPILKRTVIKNDRRKRYKQNRRMAKKIAAKNKIKITSPVNHLSPEVSYFRFLLFFVHLVKNNIYMITMIFIVFYLIYLAFNNILFHLSISINLYVLYRRLDKFLN